jgi:murein DD-endopeptidase MepM/ murein hydrolase activator NlpD
LHDGTDFGVPCGTPIHSVANGTVVSAYFNVAYGNRVIIDHGIIDGADMMTSYNHLTRYLVSPGQHVSAGQLIGISGTTGWSTGCHLHFMVYKNGATVNPIYYIS